MFTLFSISCVKTQTLVKGTNQKWIASADNSKALVSRIEARKYTFRQKS